MSDRQDIFEDFQEATAGKPLDLVVGAAVDFLLLCLIEAADNRAEALQSVDRLHPIMRNAVQAKWVSVRADLGLAAGPEGSA